MRSPRIVIAGAVTLTAAATMAAYGYTLGPSQEAADSSAAASPAARPAVPPAAKPLTAAPAIPPVTGPTTVPPAAKPVARPAKRPPTPTPARPSAPPPGTMTRAQVLARATLWHPHTGQRVPYSQLTTHDGYRTDCSGYVSMALALGRPGPITVGLASSSVTTPIAMSQLQPGDLVIDASGDNNTRHALIFVRWADSRHSAYWEYEQRGGYGTDYRTRTYGLVSGSEYHAYRPKKIR
jgi:cell wall-associated NlpC family hydrolase